MSVKIMGLVWDSALPRDEKYIAIAYADHASHDGSSIFPSVGLIAWKTGYSERSVQTITQKLIQKCVLVQCGKHPKYGTNMYSLDARQLPARSPHNSASEGVQNLRGGAEFAGEGVQKTEKGGAEFAPDPLYNHQYNHQGSGNDIEDTDLIHLATMFTSVTGCMPNPSSNADWLLVLGEWQKMYGDELEDMIDRAVKFARGDNPQGQTYKIASPRSLANIMANLPSEGQNGKVIIGAR